mmetsp:Transcript_18048/g.58924  ORF Transcript_18048/g.58924 Transcript_18048/m.58924 type:complete len:335 (+) Transcript_18048:639-1643(+)
MTSTIAGTSFSSPTTWYTVESSAARKGAVTSTEPSTMFPSSAESGTRSLICKDAAPTPLTIPREMGTSTLTAYNAITTPKMVSPAMMYPADPRRPTSIVCDAANIAVASSCVGHTSEHTALVGTTATVEHVSAPGITSPNDRLLPSFSFSRAWSRHRPACMQLYGTHATIKCWVESSNAHAPAAEKAVQYPSRTASRSPAAACSVASWNCGSPMSFLASIRITRRYSVPMRPVPSVLSTEEKPITQRSRWASFQRTVERNGTRRSMRNAAMLLAKKAARRSRTEVRSRVGKLLALDAVSSEPARVANQRRTTPTAETASRKSSAAESATANGFP